MAESGKKIRDPSRYPVPHGEPRREGRSKELRPSALGGGVTHIEQFEMRRGPIPDADELVRYGQAHPQAPEIILAEFRNQGAHRRMLERRALTLERKGMEAAMLSERIGVFSALVIALVGFGCATYLVATGHGVEGTVIFGLDVGALVSAFILGRPRSSPPGVA